jgi:hypothetical protein
VLVAFNGTDVVGHEFNMSRLFVPKERVDVTIRRDGEKRDYALEVVQAPEGVFNRRVDFSRMPSPPAPVEGRGGGMRIEPRRVTTSVGPVMAGRFMMITPHGVFGASLSPVGVDLAKALRLEKGVLVNEAPTESQAYKSGLRVGDVIVTVAGQSVVTPNDVQDQVMTHFGDRSVAVQVVREKKPVKLTLTW